MDQGSKVQHSLRCSQGLVAEFSQGSGVAEADLDAVVTAEMVKQRIPGLVLAVVQNGKVVAKKAYGHADLENMVPMRTDHILGTASAGKMQTATAVARLILEGRMERNAPITTYIPNAPAAWREITIDMLLHMRAGLADYSDTLPDGTELNWMDRWNEEKLLNVLGEQPFVFKPGTQYQYSNTAYAVLGWAVGHVLGEHYTEYLKREVWQPLGMLQTQLLKLDDIVVNRAQGVVVKPNGEYGKPPYYTDWINSGGDGALIQSIDDWIAWNAALDAGTVLPPEMQTSIEVAKPFPDGSVSSINYGAGWQTSFVRGHRKVGHSGSWAGYGSYFGRFPDLGLSVMLICTNDEVYTNQLAQRVVALWNPDLAPFGCIEDLDPLETARMKEVVSAHLERGAAMDAPVQQRRDRLEIGPVTPNTPFCLTAVVDGVRQYRIGTSTSGPIVYEGKEGGPRFEGPY